jgi:uncharacterized protein (DUF433 family)
MKRSVSRVVIRDSKLMGGAPVFKGTRVPVGTLIDYLESGASITEFLEGFPSVKRAQIVTFLEEAKEILLAA